jgi:hypothetical protein
MYKYQICKALSSECYSGVYNPSKLSDVDSESVTISCEPYDTYSITISEFDSSGDLVNGASGSLVCMYVRRELRELTSEDLSTTLDAMYEIWQTDETTGQLQYGSDYHDMDYLMGFHFYNAAWQDGDHIHEGLGFFPQHLKLTNMFERSIQAVNPAVTLPFWDFTIETANNISVWDSPMFTEDTFGSMPTPPDAEWGWLYKNADVDDARIPDGRWADAKTGVNTKFPSLSFAYGYMRAPWSMNPSPYITRFTSVDKQLPTCQSHYDLAAYTSLTDLLHFSPYEPHGSTHGVIGGVYGCDVFDDMLANGYLLDEQAQLNLCKNWLFYMKEMYRLGIISPRKGCAVSAEASTESTCGFDCNAALRSDMVKMLGAILNSDYVTTPVPMTSAAINAWADLLCNGDGYKSFGGDHLEAASAADPSFWPIHPTMDRLLQAKMMAGGFEQSSWPTDSKEDYLCDKFQCYHAESNSRYIDDSCCQGHYADDQLMITDDAGNIEYVGLTNTEMLAAVDPTSEAYSVPYIYSTFSWNHCSGIGVDIEGLLDTLHQKYTTATDAVTNTDTDADAAEAR